MEIRNIDFKTFRNLVYIKYIFNFKRVQRTGYSLLKKRYSDKKIEILGLYDNDRLVGYCIIPLTKSDGYIMILYLAIFKKYRAKGYGTVFLDYLKKNIIR